MFSNIIVLFELTEEVVDPYGFNDEDAALFAIVNVSAGIFGSFVFGYYFRKSKMYK